MRLKKLIKSIRSKLDFALLCFDLLIYFIFAVIVLLGIPSIIVVVIHTTLHLGLGVDSVISIIIGLIVAFVYLYFARKNLSIFQ